MKLSPVGEVRSTIKLGGEDRQLCFNCNCMVAFEQATGKFFLHTVSDLLDAAYPGKGQIVKSPYDILKKVSMVDLRALLWASMHDYDKDDNPVWPYTIQQVGRMLTLQDIVPTFNAFLKGQMANNPTKVEMGESPAEGEKVKSIDTPPSIQEIGGELGIELPEDAFA